MEIDRKIIAASSWIKNGIIEIYNTLFFREYFIKIYNIFSPFFGSVNLAKEFT